MGRSEVSTGEVKVLVTGCPSLLEGILIMGESSGNLPLRTCLGCSGPAPYR
jgi:hypothetical protein